MSCAACSARVEKAVSAVDGATTCTVSLLTNSMSVEGTADAATIIRAVEKAGYKASKMKAGKQSGGAADEEDALKDTETPLMRKRLIASVVLLVPLMYVSMGHMMWNWPLPPFFEGNPRWQTASRRSDRQPFGSPGCDELCGCCNECRGRDRNHRR